MDDLDHRVLGQRQDLFHLQEEARGSVFWHPRGFAIYRALEDFVRERMRRLGFREIRTPQLVDASLWERSGHLEKFREAMFLIEDGDRLFALKPMSCPCHVQVFNQGIVSWRQLPVRYAEFGACHRNEASGALHGIMRTAAFVQDDAHVFCREDQIEEEVGRFVRLLSDMYADLGFPSFEVALSTRPSNKAGDDALWDRAEALLAATARACGLEFAVKPGEGAFYGPKLEFVLTDRMGRKWQCGTVQLDFVLPGRLGAGYVAPDGSRRVPVMIHHAVLGSMERFIGILLEHYGGRLPFDLTPDQVAVMPVSRQHAAYAATVHKVLSDACLRCVLDDASSTLQRRIVGARAMGIPVVAVVGSREEATGNVSLRDMHSEIGSVSLDGAAAAIREAARRR